MKYQLPKPRLIGGDKHEIVQYADTFSHAGNRRMQCEHVALILADSMRESGVDTTTLDADTMFKTLDTLASLRPASYDIHDLDTAAAISYVALLTDNLGFDIVPQKEPFRG